MGLVPQKNLDSSLKLVEISAIKVLLGNQSHLMQLAGTARQAKD